LGIGRVYRLGAKTIGAGEVGDFAEAGSVAAWLIGDGVVVLTYVQDWQVPVGGEVQRLGHRAFVRRPLAEESNCYPVAIRDLSREAGAGGEDRAAAEDRAGDGFQLARHDM